MQLEKHVVILRCSEVQNHSTLNKSSCGNGDSHRQLKEKYSQIIDRDRQIQKTAAAPTCWLLPLAFMISKFAISLTCGQGRIVLSILVRRQTNFCAFSVVDRVTNFTVNGVQGVSKR